MILGTEDRLSGSRIVSSWERGGDSVLASVLSHCETIICPYDSKILQRLGLVQIAIIGNWQLRRRFGSAYGCVLSD